MKTTLLLVSFLCAVMMTTCTSPASLAVGERVLEGTGQGYRGLIRVLVRTNGNGIQSIEILDCQDDKFIGGAAVESLIEAVLDANTPDVDAVSGATESSQGFLEAVRNALHTGM